ncbi:unnamed protein product [Echinostoma caproni]|uniref:PPM-type phosphatase domain-containing protein n=1 Tax=Echinostoma caproni TaxID=27848 RepID=A0A183B7X3_9TREM|nr:unnamed protein product [Echinostoma caproni]
MTSTIGICSRWRQKLHHTIRRLNSDWKRSLHTLTGDHAHGFQFLGRNDAKKKIEKILSSGAVEVDFASYIESGWLSKECPIRKIYVNQLAANTPLEDRWNVGLTQVDGVVSSCLFTVLDGHSGTMCAHTLAWSLLDYVAASFLNREKLMLAMNHWRSHDSQQPYHLARRLVLLSSSDRRRLGHAASPPAPQLSAHLRLCLQNYVKELLERTDRNSKSLSVIWRRV